MTVHAPLPRLLLSLAIVTAATACAHAPRPEPIVGRQLGTTFTSVHAAATSDDFIADCDGPAGDVARSRVSTWYDIVAHVDACRVGEMNYYTSPRFEDDLVERLRDARAEGGAACASSAASTIATLRRVNRDIREYAALAPASCGTVELSDELRRRRQEILRELSLLRRNIAQTRT